jgi:hypothetical protein
MINVYEIKLMNGKTYKVECSKQDINALLDLVGDINFEYCEEL